MTSALRILRTPVFTNTQTRKKEPLKTLEPGKVKMYSCGPTVYGPIHIGNLRAALTADLIYRALIRLGYEVNYVRNYTDIDDRIIKKMQDEGKTLEQVTRHYIQLVERDYALAGMVEPTHKTLVTEHLPEIHQLIGEILKNGYGYVAADGEVFFEISKFKTYGKLSGKPIDDLIAGARVEVNPNKRNPLDFTLWKPVKPGEPSWESPWGKGRPGWHIECSAMACKWLGHSMDLHHGGEDLVFPHHENEIAQSEAATGKLYVGTWLHNAHLTFSKEKMSKSLGNVVQASDFLAGYGAEVARMVLLGAHYRSTLDFNSAAVDQALQGLERIYEAKQRAEALLDRKMLVPDLKAEAVWGGFVIDIERCRNAILDHLANDLNIPGMLSELFTLIREWNRCLQEPNAQNTPGAILAAQEWMRLLEEDVGGVLGIGRTRAESMLQKLQEIRLMRQKNEGGAVLSDAEVWALIEERKAARAAKNFRRGDEIRDQLLQAGIEIKDSPQGTTFSRK